MDSQSDTPTHIVSPEAIREALQEEKEEAMGKSDRQPFSQFSSFHALKQRRYSTGQAPATAPQPTRFPFHTTPVKLKEEEMQEHNVLDSTRLRRRSDITIPLDSATTSTILDPPSSSKTQQEKLKRPPNAYLLFNRDMRRKLLSTCPKMTVAEISKEVGDGWKSLPEVCIAY